MNYNDSPTNSQLSMVKQPDKIKPLEFQRISVDCVSDSEVNDFSPKRFKESIKSIENEDGEIDKKKKPHFDYLTVFEKLINEREKRESK